MADKIWLLDIAALDDADASTTLRFSSGGYIDASDNFYDPRMFQPALYTNKASGALLAHAGIAGLSGVGETRLRNTDGGLDYLVDYAVDGRDATLKLVDEDGSVTQVFKGTVESLRFEGTGVSVRLRDPVETLKDPHPYNVFAGTNSLPSGVEGVATDLKGKRKPRAYGKCRNVEPVMVNTSKPIWQVSDRSTASITAVRDRGVALTPGSAYSSIGDMEANAPTAGQFRAYQGYFRTGTLPSGQLTCDVDDSVNLLGNVFDAIATEAGKTLNATDKTALNAIGEVGIFLTDTRNTQQLLDLLADSCGGYWTFTANGEIRARQLVAPAAPTIVLHDYEDTEVTRKASGSGKNGLPIYKVIMDADRVEKVQSQTDLAAIISSDAPSVARYSQQFRQAIKTVSATQTRHPLSLELEIQTALRSLTVAQTQADRLGDLLSVRRDLVSVDARLDADTAAVIEIGTVVTLESSKLGYSSGRDMVVIGYTLDARISRATFELWG